MDDNWVNGGVKVPSVSPGPAPDGGRGLREGTGARMRRFLRRFLGRATGLGAGCLLLSGCFFTPGVPEAGIAIPERYREAAPRAPYAATPALDWWRQFRSSELTGLVERGLTANFDIAAAIARIEEADARARIAGGPLLPLIGASASSQRSQSSGATIAGSTLAGTPRNVGGVVLNASYEIDFWGKNRATFVAAEETASSVRFQRDVVALSTVAAIASGYFQVLAAQDRLRIARENIASAERILEAIRQRANVGTSSALEVAQQESLLASLRASVPTLVQVVQQNRSVLAVLVGQAPEFVTVRGGSMNSIAVPRVTPGLPSDLVLQRPDVRYAEFQLAAADANIHAARAALLPSIQLTGQGGYQSVSLVNLISPQAALFSIAASGAQTIFDNQRLQGQVDLAVATREELLQTYRKAIISAFSDVDVALVALRQNTERERLQRIVVTNSRRAFEIAETRLREGTIDIVTVLNTEQTLFQAQDTLAQVRLARFLAVLSLYQALGGGWQPFAVAARAPGQEGIHGQ